MLLVYLLYIAKWKEVEANVICLQSSNRLLRIDNQRLKAERDAVNGVLIVESIESDTENQSKKRSREAALKATTNDTAESDIQDRIKRSRQEV